MRSFDRPQIIRCATAFLVLIALALASSPREAGATSNLLPGVANNIVNVQLDPLGCAWDTLLATVTSSTLDTLSARGMCRYIEIRRFSTGTIATQGIGAQTPLNIYTSTKGSGFTRVDYNLITYPDGTEAIRYGPLPLAILKGCIIDGTATITSGVYVRFEP